MIRIGFGFDSHRFEAGTNKPLVLCGVKVPHDRHLVAHSDGDAPIHALIDAMFGAAGVGDIGEHFPDTNPKFANAESTRLLTDAMTMLAEMGWIVVNADVTIVAEAPRLETHKFPMRLRLATMAKQASRTNRPDNYRTAAGASGAGIRH